uniref:Purine-uracil permease NCS1-like n=1 Tax=Elaeis guineensis var. tenera TaxID=51953 RepID=A0A6I9R163_ELAGV|nr:purine-uracil permease NCS1-like [Elaeis guineensis]
MDVLVPVHNHHLSFDIFWIHPSLPGPRFHTPTRSRFQILMESSCLRLHRFPRRPLLPTPSTTAPNHHHLLLSLPLTLEHHPFPATITPSSHLPSLRLRRPPLPPVPAKSADIDDGVIPTDSDLAPTPPSHRTFSAWDMASLWVGLVVGVPSYYLAGSLVDLGMAWWQGIATVVLANLIVLIPLILTAVPGTKHGIPFPVLARSAFGVRGAHVPTLLRALVGCGWYGIETWIGGEAIFLLLPPSLKTSSSALSLIPWLGTSPLEFSCFMVFWLAQMGIVWRGMDGIRELEKYSAPILIVLTSCLLCWAYVKAGGFGRMLSLSSRLSSAEEFWSIFFPSLTANISFWATLALNIPDFTRYARSQKDQILGQAGLPVFMGIFTFVGLAVTASTEVIFGRVISDPIHLLGQIGGLSTTLIAIFGISLATITTNIAANVVAPANALVNLSPSMFTFRRGALVTALLGIAFQPWRLLSSSESFVYTWLLGYSALMGPIGGIILADYYLIKGMNLEVCALYSKNPRGPYYYLQGFNIAAIVALLVGILPIIPGFLHKVGILSNTSDAFVVAYNNAWFVSFFLSGILYWLLCQLGSRKDAQHTETLIPASE